MFDSFRLEEVLRCYKQDFSRKLWQEECYKWEAVKWFQEHWDVNAADFSKMLTQSLAKTANLLANVNNFPARMIEKFAEVMPEEVRSMFIELFDESKDVYKRIDSFKQKSGFLLEQYGNGSGQHYQKENAISTYLWLRYPDKYYIYKYNEVKTVAEELGGEYHFQKGAYHENLFNFFGFYNEICLELHKDDELVRMFRSQITDKCYSDPMLHTLTMDVGFYISRYYNERAVELRAEDWWPFDDSPVLTIADWQAFLEDSGEEEYHYWWLNVNPQIWSFSDMKVGEVQSYTLYNENGNKRRIFQNFLDAKAGDMVIGYESYPVKQIVALGKVVTEQDGEKIMFEKTEGLTSPIDYAALKACADLEQMEYFRNSQGSLFRLTKAEYELLMNMIREENPSESFRRNIETYSKEQFLKEVYMTEARYDQLVSVLLKKKNIILQGAPGVGKTFAAKRLAYSMMGEKDESRIEFIQFHQNYSYEDFVMGYKPVGDGFELKYGIFYRFCQKAANHPDQDYFFIIDEINRGNMSKIFGELLMLIERDYRGTKTTLAYNGFRFYVPERLYIIGMMNTADRSLAMIDYALRRRFSFFEMEPGFDSEGFIKYQIGFDNQIFYKLITKIKDLNKEIATDKSLGKGFCIGHSYFCTAEECTEEWMQEVVEYDIIPMLREYWFDDSAKLERWENKLHGVFQA